MCLVSHVQLLVIPWTVAHQAPLSMGILQARILECVTISSSNRPLGKRNMGRMKRSKAFSKIMWNKHRVLLAPAWESSGGRGMRHRFSSYLQGPPCLHPFVFFFDLGCGSLVLVGLGGASAPWLLSLSGQVRSVAGVFCISFQGNAGTCTGRPLVEVVPCNQSFVYHPSDHPMFQLPLPVQHLTLLEQLLQLCSRPADLSTRSSHSCTMVV